METTKISTSFFFPILLFVHFVPFLLSNKSTALLNVQAKSLPKTQILQILSSLPSAVVTPWVTHRPCARHSWEHIKRGSHTLGQGAHGGNGEGCVLHTQCGDAGTGLILHGVPVPVAKGLTPG